MAAFTETGDTIRTLNDQLRQQGLGGTIVMTRGVQALGPDTVVQVHQAVAQFDAFDCDNDPYGEHDFGTVQVQGHNVFLRSMPTTATCATIRLIRPTLPLPAG